MSTTALPDATEDSALRPAIAGLLWLPAIGLALSVVLGHLGGLDWRLDLFSHFQVQYVAVAAIGLVLCALFRAVGPGLVTLAAGISSAIAVAPLVTESGPASAEGAAPIRVVAVNLLTSNRDFDAATGWITAQDPDVVVAQEVDAGWERALRDALTEYVMLETDTTRSDNFGMAVFVRRSFEHEAPVVRRTDMGTPWVEVLVRRGDLALRVFGLHTYPPVNARASASREAQIAEALELAGASEEPAIIAGDLNATPWSASLRRPLEPTSFRPACLGQGFAGTWPDALRFTGGVLIDHVLVGPRLAIVDYAVGASIGSDHRGVTVAVAKSEH